MADFFSKAVQGGFAQKPNQKLNQPKSNKVNQKVGNDIIDSYSVNLPIWKREPYKLVSLLDIMEFQVHVYCNIFASLAEQAAMYKESTAPLNSDMYNSLMRFIDAAYIACKQTNLLCCSKYLEGRKAEYANRLPSCSEVAVMFKGLQERMYEEMSSNLFLYVEPKRADYYREQNLFGREVTEKFPSAIFDIEEAGKCYALNRSTACVYHLMRALEIPLRLLAKEIGVPEAENWNKVIEGIDKLFKDVRDQKIEKPLNWKEQEQFYSEASALLKNIKNAWRNQVMHLEKKYTEEEAERIFQSTKHFMEFLATRLSE